MSIVGEDINNAYSMKMFLPNTSLGYKLNNQYNNFPPLMSDGRALHSWQPEAVINNNIIKENNIKTNWEYRNYLTNNAKEILQINSRESHYNIGYNNIFGDVKNNNNYASPYLYTSMTDINPNIQTSDLKQMYLSREQLNSLKIIPTVNT